MKENNRQKMVKTTGKKNVIYDIQLNLAVIKQ